MSQNKSSGKTPSNLKELLRIAAKPVTFLLFLIMVCAFLAHYLTGSETLEEYALNNPELAYGTASGANTPDASTAYDSSDNADTDSASTNSGSVNSPANPSIVDSDTNSDSADSDTTHGHLSSEAETSDDLSAYNNPDNVTSASDHKEIDDMTVNTERTTYQPGFYYEPLSDEIKQKITGISYPESGCTVPYEDLNYVGLLYIDFNGQEQEGELICNKSIAQDMVEIFYELYQNQYQIERIRLIDEYDGDDTLSMLDNNTSCFNYRVVDGTTTLSKHALGCAIDINPFYNPYVVFNKDGSGETYISPKGSEIYVDRTQSFPYKIDETDLCYKLFIEHGFTWGGNWNSCKDYQHFQIIKK